MRTRLLHRMKDCEFGGICSGVSSTVVGPYHQLSGSFALKLGRDCLEMSFFAPISKLRAVSTKL